MYSVKKEEMSRLRKGYNIKELSDSLEMSSKYVYAVLSGARQCSKKTAAILVVAMGKKIDEVDKYFKKIN